MFIDLGPLKRNRNFRYLYIGQMVSFFGSMMTYVAVPYQIYQLTQSSFLVGLLGTIQLVPLIFTSLYGGALADRMDRRKLLVRSELLLTIGSLLLLVNCFLPQPSVIFIFVVSALMSAIVGFHRPAMEALTPQVVDKSDLPSIAALGSLRYSVGAIGGPALGGLMIARFGIKASYIFDVFSFFISMASLMMLTGLPEVARELGESSAVDSIRSGLRYAVSRPELVGTYLVDIIAMVFAMPTALFPALSQNWGGASAAGWLYAAMPIGSIFVALFSGRASFIKRHGAAVIISATMWGIAIVMLAFAPNLVTAVLCLALAGGADAVSALYRQVIWNETIPSELRGRLAGVEMLSYMSGPLVGNARAGVSATLFGNFNSILTGGILCVVGCISCRWLFPKFWSYKSS